MLRDANDLLHGTLDVLVLKTVSWGPMHGYAIATWIEERTRGELEIVDAALYKALHRLEQSGAIDAEWGLSENNRRAKYYALTAAGRKRLAREARDWHQTADLIAAFLAPRREGEAP
jgi:transcriptional regulator